ncbi:MAG TPA: SpoIID/LytB domain-containing protein [Gemmatimonadaceae bacterium]|nr:SpoIID/LytB domain-containing protein [Gemmatimonadaceae bacterium]
MTRRRLALLLLAAACTSAVPAPTPTVTPIPVSGGREKPAAGRAGAGAPATVPGRAANLPENVKDVGEATIRVLLSKSANAVRVSAPGGMLFTDRDGALIARARRGEAWRVEHALRRVRAVRPDGVPTPWMEGPLFARPLDGSLGSISGRPYRGDFAFYGADDGVSSVNVVTIDDYVRGVVPLEIGTRAERDSAAVQAQAVTARSYAYTHLDDDPGHEYDVTSGVMDQVYGGVAGETPVASEAVESTRTLVLSYAGRVVNAPYHSTCGGSTAAASEVWHSPDEPYLRPVSDQIPGTDRYYCDISPRFHWTRTIDGAKLDAAVKRYLAQYAAVPGRDPGTVQDVTIGSLTRSGRVATLTISTDRGNFVLRGDEIRYVLRNPGGEILNSTKFTLDSESGSDGALARLVIRGNGYGHGVGMCQWGAIGRARAGQDFRTILSTYYPGTTVGPAH